MLRTSQRKSFTGSRGVTFGMGRRPVACPNRWTQHQARRSNRMSKGTILVIDDEKDLIELVRYNLEKEGYDVIAATDGQSGLEVIKKHRPELVMLDLMMPGIDGLQVCQRL